MEINSNRLRRFGSTVFWGVLVPGSLYLIFVTFASSKYRSAPLIEQLGIDPDTFNVALFYDTLSPKRANQLGLISRHPATELVVVVISSSGCIASRDPEFQKAVRRLPMLLNDKFTDNPEMVIRLVGVALDWDVNKGIEHITKMAEFDEVIAGGNRLNVATEKFLWGEPRLGGGTPQLIVLQRSVHWGESGVVVGDERVLHHLAGPQNIAEWVRGGAPLDDAKVASFSITGT
jgi:hypothetical protein